VKVVVYGAMACGKTRHAGAIARHFGVRKVVDDWDPHMHVLEDDALHLTNMRCGEIFGATIVAYADLPNAVRADPLSATDAGCEVLRHKTFKRYDRRRRYHRIEAER
jgi:hypothetical protein